MDRTDNQDTLPPQSNRCFTDEELFVYRYGKASPELRVAIFRHLNVDRCKDCVERYQFYDYPPEDLDEIETNWPMPITLSVELDSLHEIPEQLAPGQIWTTSMEITGNTVPVLIFACEEFHRRAENVIRIMSISSEVAYYRKGHTVLLERGKPLPYPVLVNIFDERPMTADGLAKYRGAVSAAVLQQIFELRQRFREDPIELVDTEFSAWKQREIEAGHNLSGPAIDNLDEEFVIEILPNRIAAKSRDKKLTGIHPTLLWKSKHWEFFIYQIEDRMLLRLQFSEPGGLPGEVTVNEIPHPMEEKFPGRYETDIGQADQFTGSMEIVLILEGETFIFQPTFYKASRKDELE